MFLPTASLSHNLPITGSVSRSILRVRSPLTIFHVVPRSSLRIKWLPKIYSRVCENGLMINGMSQRSRSPFPSSPVKRGRIETLTPVFRSSRTQLICCEHV